MVSMMDILSGAVPLMGMSVKTGQAQTRRMAGVEAGAKAPDMAADGQVRVMGRSYRRGIGVKSRSSQTKRPVPPGQAQPHAPCAAELAVCD
jgi:hypothetical protein